MGVLYNANIYEFDKYAQRIKAMGRPYTLAESSTSRKIFNDKTGIIASEGYLGRAIMGHLMACKAEVLKRAKDIDISTPPGVQWFQVSDYFVSDLPPRKLYVNEFDLGHAYWRAAFNLGLISEKTYLKFLSFKTKKFRLIALGILAKRSLVRKFDENGKEYYKKLQVNEVGRQIFKRVAYEVSSEMERISQDNRENFRWYWFDNCIMSNLQQQIRTSYEYRVEQRVMDFKIQRGSIVFDLEGRRFQFPMSSVKTIQADKIPF